MMTSRSNICRFFLASALVTLGGLGELEPLVLVVSAKSKQDPKPPVVQPLASDRQDSITLPKGGAKQQFRTESSKPVAIVPQGQTSSDRINRKIHRHRKAGVKSRPPVIVQPKPDLSYHGILEQPQRYSPSRDRRTGRVLNPHASEIQHDHFQELDKNRDGMIDPFERAFSRLDMDRDVSNHQWE